MANTTPRIKALCKQKGITQAELAKRLGIRSTSLSQAVARNAFDLEYLERIAKALDVELWQLFTKETEPNTTLTCPHCGKPINVRID